MADNTTLNPGTGGDVIATDEIGGVQYQRIKLIHGADGVNDGDVSLANPLPQRVAAFSYPISTVNSSTAQLAAGETFTGGIETAQDQPSVSILLTSDQPITLTVRQFIDVGGTFAAPDIVFYVPAGQGFARSLTVNGNFLRILAQNTGASPTTTFNLNTAFGNLGDSDSTGVMPVSELPLVLTGAAAQTAVVNNILNPVAGTAPTSVSAYRSASIQVVSTGTGGTFIFEQSNDGTNWRPLPAFNAELTTGVPITAAITASASQIIYTLPVRCNFLRLRIATTITGGSIRAFTRLSTEPWTTAVTTVAQPTAASLQVTTAALPAGTAAIGDVGIQGRANATGAASIAKVAAAATTNATLIKATAGRVFGWSLTNTTAAVKVFRLYNLTAAPTVGTSVPAYNIVIPANGYVQASFPVGIGHATGISYAITNALPDLDATAVAANDVIGEILWL